MLLRTVQVLLGLFNPTIVNYLLFVEVAHAEEEDIWKDAIVTSPYGLYLNASPFDNLIHGSFKELVHTNSADARQYIMIDQGKSEKLIRVYIQNRTDNSRHKFGNLYVCIGDDPSSPTAPGNKCIAVPIHDGGFINLESLPAGRYVFLDRRDVADYFNLSAVRAFQFPNLLESKFGAIMIADYTLLDASYGKENLTTNLGTRTSKRDELVIDADGNTDLSINSCYSVETS